MMKISVFYKKALSVLITVCIFCGVSLIAFAEDINEAVVSTESIQEIEEAHPDAPAAAETADVSAREHTEAPAEEDTDASENDVSEDIHEQSEDEQAAGLETSSADVPTEASGPSWSIHIPDNPPVAYGARVVNVSAATAVDIEDLGDNVIYMTITSDCVFGGKADEMPVRLCVDGIPVTPGDIVVYGMVTSQGAEYAPVTLLFSENGWDAITSGSYSLTISYDSYLG